jgi:hypothetical protein
MPCLRQKRPFTSSTYCKGGIDLKGALRQGRGVFGNAGNTHAAPQDIESRHTFFARPSLAISCGKLYIDTQPPSIYILPVPKHAPVTKAALGHSAETLRCAVW